MKDDGVTRRDFLNGARIAIGASLVVPWAELLANESGQGSDYYPPAKTGLRGTHDGAWETMHARVAGQSWPEAKPSEHYDLVVVGGGISGLSAARFYRKARPNARILILDNHDDFGGHAKRNEFSINGDTRIGYGGTESIDTPSEYTAAAKETLQEIGIHVERFYDYFDQTLYSKMGLAKSIVFDQDNFGQRKLVTGYGKRPWEEFANLAPFNDQARRDFIRVQTETKDYLPGMSKEERYKLLSTTSYEAYLRDYCKVDPQLLELYRKWGISFWCVGIDEIPCTLILDYDGGMPGLDHTMPRFGSRGEDPYIFHFPDGNASVARLLVRSLIPAAMPGSTMEDVVTTRADYSQLDRSSSNVRIRLNSTAVHVRHVARDTAVDVTYVTGGKPHTVRGTKVIMACYNMAIPYICPELPAAQKKSLSYGVKVPLTYTKVLVQNWQPFAQLGTDFVYYTKDFFKQVELDYPVSIGAYKRSQTPDQPMVLHMCYVHHDGVTKGPEQWREGRRRLLTTPYSVFEHHVRDQLTQALGGAGFDDARDIKGITVNRWSHGYAYSPHLLWEPTYASDSEKPWVRGRKQFGRIAIANSDSGAQADTNSAMTQAWRAVQETLAT
ncbi:MAG: FAD/NAD(P)-binding protein [Gemmatimonadaceae bacterium]